MIYDLGIIAYLLDSSLYTYDVFFLIQKYINNSFINIKDFQLQNTDDKKKLLSYIYSVMPKLKDILIENLQKENMLNLYMYLELPLVEVIYDMEKNGILLDINLLNNLSEKVINEVNTLEYEIYKETNTKFNINSAKQLQEILFDKMKLPTIKKTKTGYSTDSEVLYELSSKYYIAQLILQYREYNKLLNTYINVLPNLINKETGRIHTTFNQTSTSTGRLSSVSPNMQNIPAFGKYGKDLRKCFIPQKGYKFVSIDYSQIELRIMAHLSEDKNLINAFLNDRDIHTETANKIFINNTDINEDEKRRIAKAVNFGIMYGQTPFGLAKQLKISHIDAQKFIDKYFEEFSMVKIFLKNTIELCKKNNYVQTICGRKRYIKDINSKNKNIYDIAQREAINSPIQGSAADIIKLAMIQVYDYLKTIDAKIILQIHDELLIEVKENIAEDVKNKCVLIMEKIDENNIFFNKLKVPLKTNSIISDYWV